MQSLIFRIIKVSMKFPKVTVVLVSAALLFVVWEQTREQPEPVDASRFSNVVANPVERSVAVDWVVSQIPELCKDATGGQNRDSSADSNCVKNSEARTSSCRRMVYDRFPAVIASEAVFRDILLTMMSCLVPRSGLVE